MNSRTILPVAACALPEVEPVPVDNAGTVTTRWDDAEVTSFVQDDGRWLTRLFTSDGVPRAEVAWTPQDAFVEMHVITPRRQSRQTTTFTSADDANARLYTAWLAAASDDVAYGYQCARGLTREGCDWTFCMSDPGCQRAQASCIFDSGGFGINVYPSVDANGICGCEYECVQGYPVPPYNQETCEERCGCSGCCDENECCI